MRECKICGNEFEPKRANAKFYSEDHYRPCKQCGNDYLVKKVVVPPEFCSGSCSVKYRSLNSERTFQCKLCGDSFISTNSNARFCSKTHTRACKKCGDEFEIKNTSKLKEYCSRKCSLSSDNGVRSCKRCGESFTPKNPNEVYCNRDHYSNCENCGTRFKNTTAKRVTRYCSVSCASSNHSYESVCELCGDTFTSGKKNSKFCPKTHYKTCEVCHNDFAIQPTQQSRTCSRKCGARITDFNARNAKSAQTMSAKYGTNVTNASQIDSVKEKKRDSAQARYGVNNVSQASEVQEARKATNVERYGVENGGGSAEAQAKIRATNLERYGVGNVFQTEEVKAKSRETLKRIYGGEYNSPLQVPAIKAKAEATLIERFGVRSVLMLPEVQLLSSSSQMNRISKVNRRWKEKLDKELSVAFELEQLFAQGMYADLALNDIYIDINPTVTHNSTIPWVHLTKRCSETDCTKERHKPYSDTHHQQRFLAAEKAGKTLLQYFDWMDEDIFISIVRSKLLLDEKRVYARKCDVREITQKEANLFLKENHLLGATKMQTFCVGLFSDDELVHVNTYGPARLNKNFEWEAIRSCSKRNWQIQGGLQRADAYFMKMKTPQNIVSYVDLALGGGASEAANPGWTLAKTNRPSATWVYIGEPEDGRPLFIKDASARRLSADKLLGLDVGVAYPEYHDDGSKFTNDDVLMSEGFVKVFDSGTRTFSWSAK